MDWKSITVLKKQKKLLSAFVLVLLFLSVLVFHALSDDNQTTSLPSLAKPSLPGDTINPQEIWLTRIENDNKLMAQKISYLETLVLETKKNETENKNLQEEIVKLKNELKEVADSSKTAPPKREPMIPAPIADVLIAQKPIHNTLQKPIYNIFSPTSEPFVPASSIQEIEQPRFVLREVTMGKSKRTISHVDHEIPSGTTVKALLVSSIDAACGVFSNSDPQPVKLRILDDGHLPKEVVAKLRGGLIIASAYGDISTERVYMRIERLTKVEPNGEFIETGV